MADKWLKYFPHTPTHGKGTLKISVKSSQYTIPARSSFKNEFPVVKFQFWRFLAFFSAAAHWQLQIASRDGAFPDFVASIYFFSTIIFPGAQMNLQNLNAQIHREFIFLLLNPAPRIR